MQEDKNSHIELTVFETIKDLLNDPEIDLRLTDRLVRDLRIDGDELSLFGILLQEKLKIDIPDEAWMEVYTIGDTIDLLNKYWKQKYEL